MPLQLLSGEPERLREDHLAAVMTATARRVSAAASAMRTTATTVIAAAPSAAAVGGRRAEVLRRSAVMRGRWCAVVRRGRSAVMLLCGCAIVRRAVVAETAWARLLVTAVVIGAAVVSGRRSSAVCVGTGPLGLRLSESMPAALLIATRLLRAVPFTEILPIGRSAARIAEAVPTGRVPACVPARRLLRLRGGARTIVLRKAVLRESRSSGLSEPCTPSGEIRMEELAVTRRREAWIRGRLAICELVTSARWADRHLATKCADVRQLFATGEAEALVRSAETVVAGDDCTAPETGVAVHAKYICVAVNAEAGIPAAAPVAPPSEE